MATYSLTPSGTTGIAPANWTERLAASSFTTEIRPSPYADAIRWVLSAGFASHYATWDVVTANLADGAVEVFARGYSAVDAQMQMAQQLMAGTADGAFDRYTVYMGGSGAILTVGRGTSSVAAGAGSVTGTTYTFPASPTSARFPGGTSQAQWVRLIRFQVDHTNGSNSGVRIQVKQWHEGESVPGSWLIDFIDTSGSRRTSGLVGVAGAYAHDDYLHFLGVGTHGDPAPRSGAPTAPSSVSATSRPYPVVTAAHTKSARTVAYSASYSFSPAALVTWANAQTTHTANYVHRVAAGASAPTDASTRVSGALSASATSYTDTTVTAEQDYDFYVEAAGSGASSFSATPANVTPSTSGVTITGWAWDFDDGESATSQNPTHTYAADGSYAAEATATASNGTTGSDIEGVTLATAVFEAPRFRVVGKFFIENADGEMVTETGEPPSCAPAPRPVAFPSTVEGGLRWVDWPALSLTEKLAVLHSAPPWLHFDVRPRPATELTRPLIESHFDAYARASAAALANVRRAAVGEPPLPTTFLVEGVPVKVSLQIFDGAAYASEELARAFWLVVRDVEGEAEHPRYPGGICEEWEDGPRIRLRAGFLPARFGEMLAHELIHVRQFREDPWRTVVENEREAYGEVQGVVPAYYAQPEWLQPRCRVCFLNSGGVRLSIQPLRLPEGVEHVGTCWSVFQPDGGVAREMFSERREDTDGLTTATVPRIIPGRPILKRVEVFTREPVHGLRD